MRLDCRDASRPRPIDAAAKTTSSRCARRLRNDRSASCASRDSGEDTARNSGSCWPNRSGATTSGAKGIEWSHGSRRVHRKLWHKQLSRDSDAWDILNGGTGNRRPSKVNADD